MSDLLQGSLGFLSVSDVLSLLSSRRASGALKILSGKNEATLHFSDGKLVAAESSPARGGASIRDVALDTLLWESGSFVFGTDRKPSPSADAAISVENLIEQAAGRREAWRRYRKTLPDDSALLRVVDNPQAQEKITLSREQWKVLVRVNGQCTVRELLHEGDEDPLQVLQILKDLLEKRLIEAGLEQAKTNLQPAKAPLAVPDEVLAADAEAPAEHRSAPDKTVMSMKLPKTDLPVAPVQPEPTIACLTLDGPEDQMFPLLEDEYRLGRDVSNTIQLNDPSVSGTHARIFRSPEGYVLEDLNSRNGTFVNGDRVQKRLLHENDRIRLGMIQLIYNIAGEKPTISPSTVFQPRPT